LAHFIFSLFIIDDCSCLLHQAPFDYNKVSQQGMSALPTHEDSIKMGRKFGAPQTQSNSHKGGGNKFKNGAVPSNPYLQSRK
jgi:hypothetical protein